MPKAPINGIDLYYESNGEGPAIVFAHGRGGNHMSWWQQEIAMDTREKERCSTLQPPTASASLGESGEHPRTPWLRRRPQATPRLPRRTVDVPHSPVHRRPHLPPLCPKPIPSAPAASSSPTATGTESQLR